MFVLVLVSSLKLKHFQSLCRSCHWDSDIFSVRPGFIIDSQTFSVLVSVLSMRLRLFQSQSRHWDSDLFSHGHSRGLGLIIEIQTFSVSASVSPLRLRHFQSWSCRYNVGLADLWPLVSTGKVGQTFSAGNDGKVLIKRIYRYVENSSKYYFVHSLLGAFCTYMFNF